jgi:tetratricopeptide (TPR) repeat protein
LIWLITRWQFLKDFVLRESLPLSPLPFFAYLALVALLAVWGRFRSAKGGPLGVVSRAWRIKAELRYPLPTVMVAAAGLAFLMIPGLIWLRPFKGQPLLQSDLNSEAARFHPASQLHNAAQADEWWDPGLIVFLRDHTAEDAVIWSGRWPCRFPIYVNRWARQVKWTGIEGIEKLRQRDPTYILFLRPSALPSDMNDLLYLSHAFEADGGLFKRVYESVQVALFRMSPTPQRMVELQLNHILAGNAYFAGEEWDKAVAEYEAALELDPDDPLAHLGLGRAYQAQGEMEKAIAALERAVGASPEDAWPYFYLGQAYASLAEMEKTNAQTYLQEAAEAYWRSLALNWENTAAGEELMKTCEKLGDWCQQAGMFDVMVAHFEEAAELAPRDGELQLALARWYQAAGRYEEAVAAYLRATDLRPGDADVYISLGAVYLAQHRVGDAAAAFERALELEPVQGHMSLARLYQREGWMDKAIAHYLAAADAAVGGRTKAHLLGKAGQIYEARGQLDRAVAHYLAAAQATGDSDTMRALYRRVADMYLAADNPEAARSLIRSVLRIAPRNAGAWSLALDVYPALIEWYEAQGKMTEARAMAWELLAIAPRHKAALQALTYYDFIANFSTADVEAPEESFPHIKITEFTMPATGDQQAVLLMLPEAHVSYRLKVPSEPSVLRFGLAVNPETWGLGGDGSTFEVHLTDERGAARLLFSEHVGNDPEEQKWHDREVSLAPFAGQEVTITFVTRPGPGGDFTGDEAGWATPRVMWAHTEEEDFWDYSEEEISVADTLKTSPQLFTTLHPLD